MKLDSGNNESNIWILIYTKAREERKAYENLKKQGFETFLPLIAPTNKNNNSDYLVPVFPRYLFVKINTNKENWNSIKYSIGVSKIVMFSDKFTSISEDIVNESTGEIYCEASDEITSDLMDKFEELGVSKLSILEIDGINVGSFIRDTLRIDKNLTPEEAVVEIYRVLRPGGRLMVLEFSRVDNEILSWMYDRYSFSLIPLMGEIIAGDRKSYQYLVESIRKFPDQDDFLEMIKLKGFKQVKFRNLSFGVAALHSAWKI